ncbi:MAG: CAP domain-containing protein [Gemmatimonadota bacterium]
MATKCCARFSINPATITPRSWKNSKTAFKCSSALLVLVGLTGCMIVPVTAATKPDTDVNEEIRALVELVNDHRKKLGCKQLVWLEPVARVAQRHSDDMVRNNYFNHKSVDGATPFQRLERAGLRYTKAAENIAAGQTTARQVFHSWLGSSGHRRNIEDCTLREHGIGFARGSKTVPYGSVTNAWTHDFTVLRP